MNGLKIFKAALRLLGAIVTSTLCGAFAAFATIEGSIYLHPQEKDFTSRLESTFLVLYCFSIGCLISFALFWPTIKVIENALAKRKRLEETL